MDRHAFSPGHELAQHGGAALAITPGFLRSEMMLEKFSVGERSWRDVLAAREGKPIAPPPFALSESPRYIGRAIAALAADDDK